MPNFKKRVQGYRRTDLVELNWEFNFVFLFTPPLFPISASALPWESRPSEICVEKYKNVKNLKPYRS